MVDPRDDASRPFASHLRLLPLLFAAAAFGALALFLWCTTARLPWEFELSKMEGGFVDHARRAANGLPIHAAPTSEFASFLYMPLAHVVAGWLVRAGLDGYAATRLLSIASLLLATALLTALCARALRTRWLAALVPLLVIARYFDVECFYDQARPDNLMSLFLALATLALSLPRAMPAIVLFVATGTLAFFTKQSSLVFLAGLLGWHLFLRPQVALAAGALLAALSAPIYFVLDARTGGWLSNYVWNIPATHHFDHKGFAGLLRDQLLGGFLVPTLLIAGAALVLARELLARWRGGHLLLELPDAAAPDARSRELAAHALFSSALGGLAFSVASSTQVLAVKNVWVSCAVASAPFLPIVFERAVAALAPARRTLGTQAGWLALTACVALGFTDPRPFRPVAEDAEEWRALHAELAKLGPRERTWITLHAASYGGVPDEPYHLHFGALSDLMGGYYGDPTGVELPKDLVEKIAQRWYAAIVIADWDPRIRAVIGASYEPAADGRTFRLPSFSGHPSGKSVIWVPKASGS